MTTELTKRPEPVEHPIPKFKPEVQIRPGITMIESDNPADYEERAQAYADYRVRFLDYVNELSPTEAKAEIYDFVIRHHKDYPQYAGKFDDWVLGVAPHDQEMKSGLAFIEGDYFLCAPEIELAENDFHYDSLSAFSIRTGWNCALSASWHDAILEPQP